MQKSIKRWFPVFILPTVIAFIISFLAPFAMGIYLSFTKFTTKPTRTGQLTAHTGVIKY